MFRGRQATPVPPPQRREKGPFSALSVGWTTFPNAPRYRPDPETPGNTSEDGATAPIGRRTGVERGVGVVARARSPTRLPHPAQALRRETLSGPPISHSRVR